MQRRHLFWAVNLALGVAALAWVLEQFGSGALSRLSRTPSAPPLVVFAGAILVAIVSSAARWHLLLRVLDVPAPLARLCAFRAASQSLAAILPGGRLGGEPLRAWYAVQADVPVPAAVTTVVVDRALEMATGLGFVVAFALVLMVREVPGIERSIAAALVGVASLAGAIAVGVHRLRRGGLVAPFVRALARRRPAIAAHATLVDDAERAARALLGRPATLARGFALGVAADLLTLVQYACLLTAFGLPSDAVAVVAAVFASGAARTLPVPGAVGTVEAAQVWIFGLLGHPAEVGLAVGLVTRLRDLAWAAPGFVYLVLRAVRPPAGAEAPAPIVEDRSAAAS